MAFDLDKTAGARRYDLCARVRIGGLMKANVIVRLKSAVHDPQGETISRALAQLAYDNVSGVRQGKFFELDARRRASKEEAEALARELANKVLSNPGARGLRRGGLGKTKLPRFAVCVFPGSNCEEDVQYALQELFAASRPTSSGTKRHRSTATTPPSFPGGFAHGDYLRVGAIARFSPIMDSPSRRWRRSGQAGHRHLQRLSDAARGRASCRGRCCAIAPLTYICRYLVSEGRAAGLTADSDPRRRRGRTHAHRPRRWKLPRGRRARSTTLEREGRIVFRYVDADGERDDAANPNGAVEGDRRR